jgi:anti-sigma factor RsiW
MNCEELSQLIPDLVDGTLPAELQAEVEATLPQCPECQREVEIARQIRAMLVALQAEHVDLRVPAGFEARLLARVRVQHTGVELIDLSSKAFGLWLVELLNVIGALIGSGVGAPFTSPARTPGLQQPGV